MRTERWMSACMMNRMYVSIDKVVKKEMRLSPLFVRGWWFACIIDEPSARDAAVNTVIL
jgi:hypothetical protein